MRVNAATIGAVTLGSSVMAQSAPVVDGPVGTTDLKDLEALGRYTRDACHKVDSAFNDFIWPCASQLKTSVKLCPTFAGTEKERIDQRDCLCGEGSSFVQDAVACSECKVQNGLQPAVQRDYWINYYKEVDEGYCQPKEVPLSFDDFRTQLDAKMPIPKGGENVNQHENKVIDPKTYYGANVPKKQGAGKAPAVVNSDKDVARPPKTDRLAGQVTVPYFVSCSDLPTAVENKTEEPINPTTSAPFQNGTATIRPTGSLPSTFLTVTTSNLAGSPTTTLLPSSSVIPAPDTVTRCVAYIVWVIVDCIPQTDAAGNFGIGYETVGIDENEPAVMLENNEQFEKVKDAIPDAGKDQKLAEDVKQHVGNASPVVPAAGKNKNLPPVKGSTGETKVPSGSQPVHDEEECEVVEDVPQMQKDPNGGSDAVVPVGQGSQPSTGKPGQSLPSTPGQNSGSGPSHSGSGPSNSGSGPSNSGSGPSNSGSGPSNSGSGPSNTGSNTCECECPSTIATATSSDRGSTEICKKKVETEDRCKALSGDEAKKCLCSSSFFDEAIKCARRTGDVRQSEFEAQILFETKYRFCMTDNSFGNSVGAAYKKVDDEWRAARNPNAILI
ncbi:hypothetical protein G3M48_007062 [Beauveria asiatica]|uniref:Uncharacterized protein n=1 Tax=Beauveria asiatica TaxID=1069075 RepID=A0AAW0RMW7_9HYPO